MGEDMGIHVIIKRKVKPGHAAKELVPLILQMRVLAMYQPGHISEETLCDREHPGECLVISRWETETDWENWTHNPERARIDHQIERLTGQKTEYHTYSPMVPRADTEKETLQQVDCIIAC